MLPNRRTRNFRMAGDEKRPPMISKEMLEGVSAAVDGRANDAELEQVLDASRDDCELRRTWARYHAIGAAMRGEWRPGAAALRERVRESLRSTQPASPRVVAGTFEVERSLPSRRQREGFACLAAFILSIPMANWMVGNVGSSCEANGLCVLPVLPGIMAPSSVLVMGLAFVLRDFVQRRLGLHWAIGAILFGAVLSALVAPPSLVMASATAFLFSELADLLVYTPLQRRRLVFAVFASSMVGLTVDSVLFLGLAYGNLEFVAGLIVGKAWMVVLVVPLIAYLRRRDHRIGLAPA